MTLLKREREEDVARVQEEGGVLTGSANLKEEQNRVKGGPGGFEEQENESGR